MNKNQSKNTTVIYARNNDDKQIKGQISQCKEYSVNDNLKLVSTFQDIGSGIDRKRKGLVKMVSFCKKNGIKNIVVTDIERLSRSDEFFVEMKQQIDAMGTEIKTVHYPMEVWDQLYRLRLGYYIKRADKYKKETK